MVCKYFLPICRSFFHFCWLFLLLYRSVLVWCSFTCWLLLSLPVFFMSYPKIIQFSSVAQSCLTLCNPMDCSTPGFPVHHQLSELAWTHVYRVGDAIQPFPPLLLLPSIFPSIRVFSNESDFGIRWPKYWSFSFSVSPSNEYSGLISLGWTGGISLQSKRLSWVFSNTTVQKHQFFQVQLSL